jgi:dolichol-phosphate mannosyltransferase
MAVAPVNNLSVIIITRNEDKNIKALLDEINNKVRGPFEIIVVDDSTDTTPAVVQNQFGMYSHIRLIRQKEKGYTNAFIKGIKEAAGDAVVIVVGDLSDEIADINRMKNTMEEGYDIICASRYTKNAKKTGGFFFQNILSYMAGKSLSLFLKIPTSDVTNSFKMYRKRIFDRIKIKDSGFAASMQVTLKAFFKGYKITEVSTIWKGRATSDSKFIFQEQLWHYLYWYFWALGKKLAVALR